MFTGTLPLNAQKSLAILGRAKCLPPKTYMAGGSGLALHLGHRISVDFDFFTPESFNQENLAKSLLENGRFTVTRTATDTLMGIFEKTKFSIFRYKYPLISDTTECFGVNIASKIDIGAMKMAAVMDRGTKKDLVDLYFLSKNGIFLENCLNFYDQKYGVLANNMYSIITGLSYFKEAEETEMPKMLKPVLWKDIKIFFERETNSLAKKYL